jgi:uncharacterized UBP type Zn finger protein
MSLSKCIRYENSGTDCFVNATLNSLFSLPNFLKFLKNPNVELKSGRGILFNELLRLANFNTQIVTSSAIVRQIVASFSPQENFWRGQHDAGEFLNKLLEALQDELKPAAAKYLKNMFKSVVKCELQCTNQECPMSRAREMAENDAEKGPLFNLFDLATDSLDNMVNSSLQGNEVEVSCTHCQSNTGVQKYKLESLPQALIFALPRFYFDQTTASTVKNRKKMRIPKSYQIGSTRYTLTASLQHDGTQASNGHYYTYSRDQRDGEFVLCNDRDVKKQNTDLTNTYLAFYRRVRTEQERVEAARARAALREEREAERQEEEAVRKEGEAEREDLVEAEWQAARARMVGSEAQVGQSFSQCSLQYLQKNN